MKGLPILNIHLIFIIISTFLLAVPMIIGAAPPSIPTPYHTATTLVCSDCHTMHASQQHGYSGSGSPELFTPTERLLRRTSSVQLCLSCHDGQSGVPDVLTTDTNSLADRAAGFFAANPDTATYQGHNLGQNPGDLCIRCHMGGEFSTAQVTCIDCHNPHGNGGYRNLQWASVPGDPSQPKIIAFTDATDINKYDQSHVGYSAPSGDNTWREVTNICQDCHHTLSGESNTALVSPYKRHPITDSEKGVYYPINRAGANTDPTNWMNGTNGFSIGRLPFLVRGATTFSESTTVAQTNEVFCLSCHKAHGSNNSFGLRWAYGSGATGINQAGCNQCHNK